METVKRSQPEPVTCRPTRGTIVKAAWSSVTIASPNEGEEGQDWPARNPGQFVLERERTIKGERNGFSCTDRP